jgi:hypothetical protein
LLQGSLFFGELIRHVGNLPLCLSCGLIDSSDGAPPAFKRIQGPLKNSVSQGFNYSTSWFAFPGAGLSFSCLLGINFSACLGLLLVLL